MSKKSVKKTEQTVWPADFRKQYIEQLGENNTPLVPQDNRVVMNGRLAVVVSIHEAWSTAIDSPKAILMATDRPIVEAVLTRDLPKAINLWNTADVGLRREEYNPDTSDLSLTVKWVKIGQLFRITWDSDNNEEVIEDYTPSEWYLA